MESSLRLQKEPRLRLGLAASALALEKPFAVAVGSVVVVVVIVTAVVRVDKCRAHDFKLCGNFIDCGGTGHRGTNHIPDTRCMLPMCIFFSMARRGS